MITVLLADDEAMVRAGVRAILPRMPALDGLGAGAELRRAVPGVAVVMLTTFSGDEYITAALDSGRTAG